MEVILELFMGLLVFIALAPLIRTQLWWIRIWDFPRVQVAVVLMITLTVYLRFFEVNHWWEFVLLAGLGSALLYKCIMIYPFTPFAPVQALRSKVVVPRNGFSMLISNVRMTNRAYERFLKMVRKADPDLLLINEPDQHWADAIKELDEVYPYAVKNPLPNTYGMMLYSKLELVEGKINYLVKPDIPSFSCVLRLPSGRQFCLFCVHPEPPSYDQDTDTREAELLIVAKKVKANPYASIVAGDLNDVAWSHTTKLFKKISGLLDPRIGRGFYNTYNAHVPFFRYPLDHVFYDPSFRLVNLRRLGAFGSDHFPIYMRLNYEPREADEQDVLPADHEDVKEAEELIDKVKSPE